MRDRWEALDPRTQALVAFPIMWIFWFVLNLGPFAQPLVRTVIYAFLEGGFCTGALVYITKNERERRKGDGGS